MALLLFLFVCKTSLAPNLCKELFSFRFRIIPYPIIAVR